VKQNVQTEFINQRQEPAMGQPERGAEAMQYSFDRTNPAAGAIDKNEAPAREFLTFRLGHESYGIETLKVQEIRGYEAPTAIANAPAFIKGVIDLRGVIVPILDLRIKFRLQQASYDEFTIVIILNLANRVVGVVVDSVSDVLTFATDTIRPKPEFASSVFDTQYITGLATVDGTMLILLEIEKLMRGADMALVDETVH
jgi:purine-binding chemotaxis protein CheW